MFSVKVRIRWSSGCFDHFAKCWSDGNSDLVCKTMKLCQFNIIGFILFRIKPLNRLSCSIHITCIVYISVFFVHVWRIWSFIYVLNIWCLFHIYQLSVSRSRRFFFSSYSILCFKKSFHHLNFTNEKYWNCCYSNNCMVRSNHLRILVYILHVHFKYLLWKFSTNRNNKKNQNSVKIITFPEW